MNPWPIIPKTLDQLEQQANAPGGKGFSEAVAWVAYDTETYVSATTRTLDLFSTTKALGLSNMQLAGAFPAPQFFELYGISLDILTPPQTTPQSAITDVWNILFGTGVAGAGAPFATLSISDKVQFRLPVSLLHGTGGPLGFGWSDAANAGASAAEWANNSVPDGGFPLAGSIMIPPTVGFGVALTWPTAVTLSADRSIRLSMHGTLHRRIL